MMLEKCRVGSLELGQIKAQYKHDHKDDNLTYGL